MGKFNEQAFFEELLLMYLYKKHWISTDEIEDIFGGIFDEQNVNNVICNRNNNTSYIKKGFIDYDDVYRVLRITEDGIYEIEKNRPLFLGHRS